MPFQAISRISQVGTKSVFAQSGNSREVIPNPFNQTQTTAPQTRYVTTHFFRQLMALIMASDEISFCFVVLHRKCWAQPLLLPQMCSHGGAQDSSPVPAPLPRYCLSHIQVYAYTPQNPQPLFRGSVINTLNDGIEQENSKKLKMKFPTKIPNRKTKTKMGKGGITPSNLNESIEILKLDSSISEGKGNISSPQFQAFNLQKAAAGIWDLLSF